MARSMWRGAISFGMVAIPIRMYVATEAHSVSFRLLCPHCQQPIKNLRHCPTDNHVVNWNEVLRGYEVGKDRFVILDDEDLDKLPLKTTRTIDIVEFVERSEVPMGLYLKSAYYLEPEEVGIKPFYLLKRALEETGKVAVAKVALRDREHLCLIQSEGNTLLCNTLNWPDEIRPVSDLNLPEDRARINEKEVRMATSLIENLSDRFSPERYTDDYKVALQQVVEQKLKGLEIAAPAPAPEPKVMDLMAALRASIDATKREKEAAPAKPAAAQGKTKVAAKTAVSRSAARRRSA